MLDPGWYGEAARRDYAWMRANAPVYYDEKNQLWGVSTYQGVRTAEGNAAVFSNAQGSRAETGALPWMMDMDAPDHTRASGSSGDRNIDGLLPPDKRPMAFVMLTIWSCTEGLIVWGLYIQVVDVFKSMGLSAAAAVGIWAMVGPSQALARFGELMLAGRHSILSTALMSGGFSCASFFGYFDARSFASLKSSSRL